MSILSVSQAPRKRRRFSHEFKARIVAACQQPDSSVSRIALDNGLNANMVRRWIRESERTGSSTAPAFMQLSLPVASAQKNPAVSHNTIRIEVPRTSGSVVVEWPANQADQCAALLRGLLQ